MTDAPETRYTWNGDVALAYQILGEGPTDLVYLQGWCSHIDLAWDSPYLSSFLRGLAMGSRLILTDRRGWGCSDRFSPSDVPTFEVMTDDLLAILEAAGAARPAIFASVECAPIAVLFAAMYPERVSGLILCDPTISYCATEDTPWMWTKPEWDAWAREVRDEYPLDRWWQGPSEHPERAWFERYVRASIAPGALIAESTASWRPTSARSSRPCRALRSSSSIPRVTTTGIRATATSRRSGSLAPASRRSWTTFP